MEQSNAATPDTLKWYHYLTAFLAGFFLANTVPHFVNGISGDPFPSPFADPPGKGLSSPLVNVLWALLNLVIGYLLFRFSKVAPKNKLILLFFFIGIVLCSVMLSTHFSEKMRPM